MNKLAQYLTDTRQSQIAFAEAIGCDKSIVSRLTRFEMVPSLELAVKIQNATDGFVSATSWISEHPVETAPPQAKDAA